MGMVTREIEFRNRDELSEYLKIEYNIELYPDVEELGELGLGDILVKAEIVEIAGETVLRLKKLVSLKAFLLSAEAGMDINKLVFDIDNLMDMSQDGLNWSGMTIADDGSLEEFFKVAGIEKVSDRGEILKDAKRSVKVKKIMGNYDFNSIEEI